MHLTLPLFGALSVLSITSAFYLPGVAPTDYKHDDRVPLIVNHFTPELGPKHKLKSVVSYDYYHPALNLCQPPGGPKQMSESLGSILFGDRLMSSPFDIHMGRQETCKALCGPQKYDKKKAKFVNRLIWQHYNFNWLIDGLPAATVEDEDSQFYAQGFKLGRTEPGQEGDEGPPPTYLHNHYDIIIEYHKLTRSGIERFRVVGVEVRPQSISSTIKDGIADCSDSTPVSVDRDGDTEVNYTYSVSWKESNTPWATRWDKYLHVLDPNIHWISLVNSVLVAVILSALVLVVLLRALRKDIARYNQLDINEDVQDDSGWKLVHGDVFRAPKNPLLLSIFLGSGAQLFFMVGATILFALLGFLSPSNRGSLATVMILLYTLFGFIGGYVSARAYKSLGGDAWKKNIVLTPVFIPGIVFGTFFFLNIFLAYEHSSGAVPFATMLALILIWFIISVPLSCAGSWLGFKAPVFAPPVRTNQIPRQIPPQQGWLRPTPSMLMAGTLPFGAICLELYYIMNSIWFHKVYYMFGFLFVTYGIMVSSLFCSTEHL